jgi:DNA-binding NtrC family response regulator
MTCRLIVCEKTNRWATALRTALGRSPLQVAETRSLAGCEAALAEAPDSLVAVEVTPANLDQAVDFIEHTGHRFPRVLVVALLAEDAASAERLMQEAGAVDAISSVLDVPRIARLARRHHAAAPPPEIGFDDVARQRLPWSAHA